MRTAPPCVLGQLGGWLAMGRLAFTVFTCLTVVLSAVIVISSYLLSHPAEATEETPAERYARRDVRVDVGEARRRWTVRARAPFQPR